MSRRLGKGKVQPTVDELISTLKHSTMPTILIEGDIDIIAYRPLEKIHEAHSVSLLSAGGREAVLEIYRRRGEISWGENLIFVVDQDAWCVNGIPEAYQAKAIITTNGYSIENDVICDGELVNLLDAAETADFNKELDTFLQWYALAFSRYLSNSGEIIKVHPSKILDDEENRSELLELKEGEAYPENLRAQLAANPLVLIRGKSLFNLLMRQLSYPQRHVKHQYNALIETVAASPGENLGGIFHRAGALLDEAFGQPQ
ncbi:DUF4435 domain-containing protein [Phyllobacterium pellucidum]|uniref:DUF4435 domain-containing protein n=1 Tax=Phyllobacterium pellucidum TaxID=2740464 RepID=UPI001D13E154|nr:DUF4435 domain-containing protein [Phyllobacterium sp. T1018]UGY10184.1 DUF4435 domain-containing protein [Phyllobacterium sp. T1018]